MFAASGAATQAAAAPEQQVGQAHCSTAGALHVCVRTMQHSGTTSTYSCTTYTKMPCPGDHAACLSLLTARMCQPRRCLLQWAQQPSCRVSRTAFPPRLVSQQHMVSSLHLQCPRQPCAAATLAAAAAVQAAATAEARAAAQLMRRGLLQAAPTLIIAAAAAAPRSAGVGCWRLAGACRATQPNNTPQSHNAPHHTPSHPITHHRTPFNVVPGLPAGQLAALVSLAVLPAWTGLSWRDLATSRSPAQLTPRRASGSWSNPSLEA
jgi:hypothetical protein